MNEGPVFYQSPQRFGSQMNSADNIQLNLEHKRHVPKSATQKFPTTLLSKHCPAIPREDSDEGVQARRAQAVQHLVALAVLALFKAALALREGLAPLLVPTRTPPRDTTDPGLPRCF